MQPPDRLSIWTDILRIIYCKESFSSPDYSSAVALQPVCMFGGLERPPTVREDAPPPYPPSLTELLIASSGPEMGHGRTTTDVLTDLLEETLVRPTAAQPDHDPPTTHHDGCCHLDHQQSPRRRVANGNLTRTARTTHRWPYCQAV